ncbi:unnamed protein product [Protopolystoma xenopodis]|uniref:Uncharacterized protein n=1 Tax=Protopolystoma xenopodis TaxID=117903 RepID=A0A448X1I2_9PLAT|nr:unnamed protein product [Protopolystoma xenopodis]
MAVYAMWALVAAFCIIATYRDMTGVVSEIPSNKDIPKIKFSQNNLPTVRFSYWRVFEEMSQLIQQRFPGLWIQGEIHPPPAWCSFVAGAVQIIKFTSILIAISGLNPFPSFGLPTPSLINYAHQNKVIFDVRFIIHRFRFA